jgi:hypothetical protein
MENDDVMGADRTAAILQAFRTQPFEQLVEMTRNGAGDLSSAIRRADEYFDHVKLTRVPKSKTIFELDMPSHFVY